MTYEEINNILTATAQSLKEIAEFRKTQELELAELRQKHELEHEALRKEREQEREALRREREQEREALRKERKQEREALLKEREKSRREMELSFKRVNEQLGGIGQTQGDIAEDMFRRSVPKLLAKRGLVIKRIETQLRAGSQAEFDLVVINDDCVVVVEVKNKINARNLRKFAAKQLPRFKHLFTEFSNYTVYGGVAAMIFKDDIEQQAENMGLFVFTQSNDGNAQIANTADFHARKY
ncbi:MAG: hypothetical protein R8L53_09665 [Mariprofundales bacterium]